MITLDGTLGITSPAETVQGALTTTGNTILGDASTDTLNVGNGGLVKDASGNVGIGTSGPNVRLHIKASASTFISFAQENTNGGTDAKIVDWLNNGNTYSLRLVNDAYNAANSAYSVERSGYTVLNQVWYTGSSTERMRIDSSGNVLVGTTSQLYGEILNATNGGASKNAATFYFNTSDDRATVIVRHAGASGATSRTQISFLDSAGTQRGSINSTGSATTYVTSSDYRLKENITPMIGALATIAQLKPVTYNWKDGGFAGQGFIAHELAEVVPDCVAGEKDAVDAEGKPQYQGIDTSFLVATLTAAIQEQQALITQLQADVATLKALSA